MPTRPSPGTTDPTPQSAQQPARLPFEARRQIWDQLWTILLAPPKPKPPTEPVLIGDTDQVERQ